MEMEVDLDSGEKRDDGREDDGTKTCRDKGRYVGRSWRTRCFSVTPFVWLGPGAFPQVPVHDTCYYLATKPCNSGHA